MQFSTPFSAAIFAAIFAAIASAAPVKLTSTVKLYIDNNGAGSGVGSTHEGAGINYLPLTDSVENSLELQFDEETGEIYQEVAATENADAYRLSLGSIENSDSYTGFPFVQLSVVAPNVKWENKDGKLVPSGKDDWKFYIAKNANDPYRVSANSFVLGLGDADVFGGSVTDLAEVLVSLL